MVTAVILSILPVCQVFYIVILCCQTSEEHAKPKIKYRKKKNKIKASKPIVDESQEDQAEGNQDEANEQAEKEISDQGQTDTPADSDAQAAQIDSNTPSDALINNPNETNSQNDINNQNPITNFDSR